MRSNKVVAFATDDQKQLRKVVFVQAKITVMVAINISKFYMRISQMLLQLIGDANVAIFLLLVGILVEMRTWQAYTEAQSMRMPKAKIRR